MKQVYAIDPGYEQSALVVFDGSTVLDHRTVPNAQLVAEFADDSHRFDRDRILVVEQIASFGMPVGAEVFETVFWSGRFVQAWTRAIDLPWDRVKRHAVKTALCQNQRAKDAHIRQALLDRFGPGREKAIGTKRVPGPLYGIAGDEWAALAVAVTWWDANVNMRKAG